MIISCELAYGGETNYEAQNLINLSYKAKEIKESTFNKFIVSSGKRLFVIQIANKYMQNVSKLINIKKKKKKKLRIC